MTSTLTSVRHRLVCLMFQHGWPFRYLFRLRGQHVIHREYALLKKKGGCKKFIPHPRRYGEKLKDYFISIFYREFFDKEWFLKTLKYWGNLCGVNKVKKFFSFLNVADPEFKCEWNQMKYLYPLSWQVPQVNIGIVQLARWWVLKGQWL